MSDRHDLATRPDATDGALEIIALSLDDALAAEEGGATRLEVVRDIHEDGLTPDVRLVEALLARVRIPLRVMVRPRNVFEVGDAAHRAEIARDAALFASLPVDIVTGYIESGAGGVKGIDESALALVIERVPSARVTFHRAIEHVAADPVEIFRRHPAVDRVLSGGGAGPWSTRAAALDDLQQRLAPMRVIVGGGVTQEGIDELVGWPSLRELHLGRLARRDQSFQSPVDATIVEAVWARWHDRPT